MQVTVRDVYSIDVSCKDFWEQDMAKFNNFVGKLFKPSLKCYPECENGSAVVVPDVHDYLCFDLLDLYDPASKNSYRCQPCSLSDVPSMISITDKEFALCGVIEKVPGHFFIAHTRTAQGRWKTSDGLYPKKRVPRGTYKPHHMSMLVYVTWR